MAPSTLSSYTRAVHSFSDFVHAQYGTSVRWPIDESKIVAFIAFLSLKGMAAKTISVYIWALSYVHKLNSLPDPTNNFLVRKLLEGVKRSKVSIDNRLPLTFDLLTKLVGATQYICSNAVEVALFKATYTIAFFAFLRVSEFTVKSKAGNNAWVLQRNDVSFQHSHMTIVLRHAKNNQYNNPTHIQISRLHQQEVCPVLCMQSYLKAVNHRNGPLFKHFDGSVLTRFQFQAVLKKCLMFCGLDPGRYKSHSFRIGAASTCAASGVSLQTIKQWGRWKSEAVKGYVRPVNSIMTQKFSTLQTKA